MDQIKFNPDLNIDNCDFILIMVITNGLLYFVDTACLKLFTVHDIMHNYDELQQVILHCNRHAISFFCCYFAISVEIQTLLSSNCCLHFVFEKWCAKSAGRHVFIHTHKLLLGGARLNLNIIPNMMVCTLMG